VILRTYTRVFVEPDRLDATVAFHLALTGGREVARFDYPETGLALAIVESPNLSVLVIAGSADKRAPFEATKLTIKVDRLEPTVETLIANGAEHLEPIARTPVGRKTRFRHPDGSIVEYVDHDADRRAP